MKILRSSMTYLLLRVLSILLCTVSLEAVRYGDYSVARMPQYGGQHEDDDLVPGADDYSDRSPEAPARLDYKYEEESHGKSGDVSVADIDEEIKWDKKKRKPVMSQDNHNFGLDKDTFDELIPEFESHRRLVKHRSRFQNRNFNGRLKHNLIDQSDDIDNVENKNENIQDIHAERAGIDDFEEIPRLGHSWSTQKKARRKPRDRALHQLERVDDHKGLKLQDEDAESILERNEYFENKRTMRSGYIIDRADMSKSKKKNYDYDEYYDMKRVHNMKNRMPALFRQTTDTTVRTTEAQSTRSLVLRQYRRARAPLGRSGNDSDVTAHVENVTHTTIAMTTPSSTVITESTVEISSELSLGEKSRLSILRKAHRKESSKNVSSTTKPPVLLQVTHKMQTLVVVEPQPAAVALRSREVAEDSPARLQRARRLMRHKLVAGARSIHDLTDNWDEMVCDYIDVALLDTDTTTSIDFHSCVAIFIPMLWSLLFNL